MQKHYIQGAELKKKLDKFDFFLFFSSLNAHYPNRRRGGQGLCNKSWNFEPLLPEMCKFQHEQEGGK